MFEEMLNSVRVTSCKFILLIEFEKKEEKKEKKSKSIRERLREKNS